MTRSFTRKFGFGAVCIGALIWTPALAGAQSAQTSNGDVTLQSSSARSSRWVSR